MTSTFKTFLTAALLATGLASTAANANLPQTGQGLVLVPPAAEIQASNARDYAFKRGQIVDFDTTYPAGSIVVITRSHALYFVIGNAKRRNTRSPAPKRASNGRAARGSA